MPTNGIYNASKRLWSRERLFATKKVENSLTLPLRPFRDDVWKISFVNQNTGKITIIDVFNAKNRLDACLVALFEASMRENVPINGFRLCSFRAMSQTSIL